MLYCSNSLTSINKGLGQLNSDKMRSKTIIWPVFLFQDLHDLFRNATFFYFYFLFSTPMAL